MQGLEFAGAGVCRHAHFNRLSQFNGLRMALQSWVYSLHTEQHLGPEYACQSVANNITKVQRIRMQGNKDLQVFIVNTHSPAPSQQTTPSLT